MDTEDYSVESKAEKLFMEGVELERNYRHYDAIKYYRKALQLVPDIDIRLYKANKLKDHKNIEDKENCKNQENKKEDCDSDDEYDGNEPLNERIQRILEKSDNLFFPSKPQKGLHLSDLPREIMEYIFKWVVSNELDLRSLDQCAIVCRGFYLYARDSYVWKIACERIWKNEKLNLEKFDSWRNMFINRPHISMNGCYIAETKYYRQGERSFQDENYRPYHLVFYYRYLRFFVDGKVMMVNTPDPPNIVVGQLKLKNAKLGGTIFYGRYEMVDDIVNIEFKLKKKRAKNENYISIAYNMKFEIKMYKKWKTKLIWKQYKYTIAYTDDDTVTAEENFLIKDNLFPPLRFSRVKSYTAEAEHPLI